MSMPNLVLLAGHMCTSALWDAPCRALAEVAHCLPMALDEGDTMASVAAAILRRAPDRFALAALSMGGNVAMEIMRQAPQRVERLALIGTRAGVDSPERATLRQQDERLIATQGLNALISQFPDRWLARRHAQDPALRRFIIDMASAVSPDVRARQLRALTTRIDSYPSLARITCPTMIICGTEDQANPIWMQQEMAAHIAHSQLRFIEGCGHLSPIEAPETLSQMMREWLDWHPCTAPA